MSDQSTYTITLYGGLRQFSSTPSILLPAYLGDTVVDIKARLLSHLETTFPHFTGQALIDSAVLANESTILSPTDPIHPNQILALLPPVCGG